MVIILPCKAKKVNRRDSKMHEKTNFFFIKYIETIKSKARHNKKNYDFITEIIFCTP